MVSTIYNTKDWTATLLLIAPTVSAVVAVCAFMFAVWNTFLSGRREASRRDWERLQALAQIMHRGSEVGEWAQTLAVQELAGLKTKRVQALLLAKGALTYWENNKMDYPALLSQLRKVVDELAK